MMTIDKNQPPTEAEVQSFLEMIDFMLPEGFIDFFKEANGADVNNDERYLLFWPLTEMIELNKAYNVHEFAPAFFLFGSDGGDTAYAIERITGNIFEMPFIGMANEEAAFKQKSFTELLTSLQ